MFVCLLVRLVDKLWQKGHLFVRIMIHIAQIEANEISTKKKMTFLHEAPLKLQMNASTHIIIYYAMLNGTTINDPWPIWQQSLLSIFHILSLFPKRYILNWMFTIRVRASSIPNNVSYHDYSHCFKTRGIHFFLT